MQFMIGVCGFVNSGSSAVCDLLKEFDEAAVIDHMELSIAFFPDGLEELEFHLMTNVSKYMSSNVAIERFRRMVHALYEEKIDRICGAGFTEKVTDAYLDSIVQIRWQGFGRVDRLLFPGRIRSHLYEKYIRFMNRTDGRFYREDGPNPFERRMEFSIRPENFHDATRAYLGQIIGQMCKDPEKKIVVNQPFAANDPEKSFHFFDDPHAIIVDRDPRDLYLLARKFQRHRGRMIPSDSVDKFITFFERTRGNMPYKDLDGRSLYVRFEDLVYDYAASVRRIMAFAGIENHSRPRTIFVPEMSAANTQVFLRYPEEAENIRKIERALPEYLYPFEQYPPMDTSGELFAVRSPLNRKKSASRPTT